ncbi:MAG: hypothetical protein ABIH20_06120 [Candidatus Diapherotrites archaeon]
MKYSDDEDEPELVSAEEPLKKNFNGALAKWRKSLIPLSNEHTMKHLKYYNTEIKSFIKDIKDAQTSEKEALEVLNNKLKELQKAGETE